MIDKLDISKRFFSCYEIKRSEMARLFALRQSSINAWAERNGVPWIRLKYLSDTQAISWDWLIEGREPRTSVKDKKKLRNTKPEFNRSAINKRFLSLFQNMTQTDIARLLNVTPTTVHEWFENKRQVPWQRLADAVDAFGVRWDWIIDGLQPKYRE